MPVPAKDMTGQRFGRLVVLVRAPIAHRHVYWQCLCDCGTVVNVRTDALRSGKTNSCACLQRETATKHGQAHGHRGTPEYGAWVSMKGRCLRSSHQAFHNYGGRGITIYASWIDDFAAFFAEVGPRPSPDHSLDRINNDGNYEPGNVRWATRSQQMKNRRRGLKRRSRKAA